MRDLMAAPSTYQGPAPVRVLPRGVSGEDLGDRPVLKGRALLLARDQKRLARRTKAKRMPPIAIGEQARELDEDPPARPPCTARATPRPAIARHVPRVGDRLHRGSAVAEVTLVCPDGTVCALVRGRPTWMQLEQLQREWTPA